MYRSRLPSDCAGDRPACQDSLARSIAPASIPSITDLHRKGAWMDRPARIGAEQLARWADRLQAMARTGLFFAGNDYDRERYQAIIGIAAEMAGLLTDRPALEFQTLWVDDPGYVTPRVGVGAAIFDEHDRVLLLKRSESTPERPLWGI